MDVQADLSDFGLGPMVRLVAGLRDLGTGCASVEEFAQRVCRFLHECFVDGEGEPQTALVRFYATSQVGRLPPEEQQFARRAHDGDLSPGTSALALMGTAGRLPGWNDRGASVGHRVIPLIDPDQVERLPMIAALLGQLGIDVRALVSAHSDVVLPVEDGRYRVFYVPHAVGSPLIPAQDFVADHGIASALGFGGALPTGEVYAVVVFSRVRVPLASAALFATVALSTSLAAVDMLDLPLFTGQDRRSRLRPDSLDEHDRLVAKEDLTRALLQAHEQAAASEADKAVMALEQARYDAARAAALAVVALRLGSVRTVAAVTELLVTDGLPVLGADGGSLALVDADRASVTVEVSGGFGPDIAHKYASLPLDDSLPTVLTARTGERVLVPDAAAGLSRFPALAQVYGDIDAEAIASLPLVVDQRLLGALTFTWRGPHSFTDSALEVMEALAAQAAQAVDRARLLELERRQSETLQRSFLTRPPSTPEFEIEVRYLPAAAHAQIGGDWYDAFVGPDGSTVVTIGDVVGHDMFAAAAMGQLRSLLRGVAFSSPGSPAVILGQLDAAISGLGLDACATVALAQLGMADAGLPGGSRALTWTNAGHPPPLLLTPDGAVRALDAEYDLMIGVDPRTSRHDHTLVLERGSTLLLYTDGLVERRGEDLQQGIDRLTASLAAHGGLRLGALCEAILALVDGPLDDDVALLAVRLV